MTAALAIVIDKTLVPDKPFESVTSKLGEVVPAAVAVPVRAPVDEFNERPAGREPDKMLQTYGVVPPAAASDDT